MKKSAKKTARRFLALMALLALGSTLFTWLAIPAAEALDLEFEGLEDFEESLCEDIEGGVFECAEGESTSFVDFEGEFAPPSEEGYAEGITQTSSAREFVVNVTNFVLSFLGLAAIVVIIYGGFMYVTAAGEQERIEKGKKSVMYAVIGIIIVLISYALVNTIIQGAAGGEDVTSSDGLYSSGDVTGEEVSSRAQAEAIAEDIQELTNLLVEQYTVYSNVNAILDAMEALVEFDEDGLQEFEEGFGLILEQVDSFTQTADYANEALTEIRTTLAWNFQDGLDQLAEWLHVDVTQAKVLLAASDPYGLESYITNKLDQIRDSSLDEYTAVIDDEINRPLADIAYMVEGLSDISDLVLDIIAQLGVIPTSSGDIGNVLNDLNELYNMILDLQFTTAVITANTKEGNAPMTVTFDGLDSYDPSNLTLDPENYQWDLDGDGTFESTGANVSAEYSEEGTYRVALLVESMDPEKIASGLSYISIKVNPASSDIVLSVTLSDGETKKLTAADPRVQITQAQAEAGLIFNACETTGKSETDTIVNYKFNFGDGREEEGEVCEYMQYYVEEGTFDYVLEVTNQDGVTDRRYVDVVVASPAAFLDISNDRPEIGVSVNFDAGASVTDAGTITNYQWEITGPSGTVYEDDGTDEEIDYEFTSPGDYTITLTVTDSAGESASVSDTLTVASTAPSAAFSVDFGDSKNPGQVELDASKSSDPDEGDELSYAWEIEGDYEVVEGDASSEVLVIEFNEVGEYEAVLTATDQYGESDDYSKTIDVESVLSINVTNTGDSTIELDDEGTAAVELELESNIGTFYDIDWGDNSETESVKVSEVGSTETVEHEYNEGGQFIVRVTVYDDDDNENSMKKRIYVGDGTTPIPTVAVSLDGITAADDTEVIGNRTNTFKFDGEGSKDLDGDKLKNSSSFSWDFGDGSTPAQGKSVTHTYDEVGEFEATLTVISEDDSALSASITFDVIIEEFPPRIYGLTAQPQDSQLVTPLQVKLSVNADDEDGDIVTYKFWYYDVSQSSEKLGEQVSTTSTTLMTVNTSGESGDTNTYQFAVEVTDDENNTTSSLDELDEDEFPELDVENGPNQAPEADFEVDKSNILIGDSVTFRSTSTDEDGEIVSYTWDFEGDGFHNNTSTTDTSVTYVFDSVAEQGIQVRLKVEDDGGATDTSDPVRIFVDTLTEDPVAAFSHEVGDDPLEVVFTNNSSADEDNDATIESYAWDFDANEDSDGDGDATNDEDSSEENPTHMYDEFGSYNVTLVVTDNEGNTDDITNKVDVEEPEELTVDFTYEVDGLTVTFTNTTDVPDDVTIEEYSWEFGAQGNSEEENPSFAFSSYGTHSIKLTVTDNYGRTDTATESVTLEEPVLEDLEVSMSISPAVDPSGYICTKGSDCRVTVSFQSEGHVGTPTFCVDRDAYYDCDGSSCEEGVSGFQDGTKNNDCNYETTATSGSTSFTYKEDYLPIMIQVIVTDEEGRTDVVRQEVKFKSNEAANILPVTTAEALYILATALGFTILGAKLYTRKNKQ